MESPHISISPELKESIQTKLSHVIRMYERPVNCEVVLRKEKDEEQKYFHIEVKLQVPGGSLFATEKAESFEIALDKLTGSIRRQLQKHKEKLEEAR